jgi:hypothetical protein
VGWSHHVREKMHADWCEILAHIKYLESAAITHAALAIDEMFL